MKWLFLTITPLRKNLIIASRIFLISWPVVEKTTIFDEKVEMSLENWEDFIKSIKEIQDLPECSTPLCGVGTFVEKLYSHMFSSKSPCLIRDFFINVCKM